MSQDTGLVTAKVVAMVVLGGASMLLGLTPLVFSRLHRRRAGGGGRHQLGTSPRVALFISLMLAFGGGALLCTTFLHMLPEVRETVEELQESGTLVETKFHLPELLMCAGFFAMYLVEELVHLYLHHRRHRASPNRLECGPGAHTTDSALHRSLSKRRCSRADASCPPGVTDLADACDADAQGTSASLVANGAAANLHADSERVLVLEGLHVVAVDLEKKLSAPQHEGETKRTSAQEDDPYLLSGSSQQLLKDRHKTQPLAPVAAVLVGLSGKDSEVPPVALSTADGKKLTNGTSTWADTNGNLPAKSVHHPAKHVHHGQAHVHVHLDVDDVDGEDSVLSSLRGLLIVLALSVHELFEGLAVGLQETANLVYYMMGAVAAHKLVLAFCVGVQLIAAGTRPRYIVCYVLTFALVSPIGIGVGLALGAEEGASVGSSAATATLQGLACGTLLYVVFFEILQREAKGIRQYFATAAGFLIMFAVLITTSEEHDHGHSHGHDHDHGEEHEEAITSATTLALSAVTEAVTNLVVAR